jgi:hypothetical protein
MKRILTIGFVLTMVAGTTLVAKPFKRATPKPKPLPLGGVEFGMTEEALLKKAKSRRRQLVGPGKGMISHEEMVQVKEYVVGKDRQLDTVSGAKAQTIMLLGEKVLAVKFHFVSKSSLDGYVKKLVKQGFVKDGESTAYEGKVQTGDLTGRKVRVLVNTLTVGRRKKYDVILSCTEVFGKGVTAKKLIAAQKGGGVRRGGKEDKKREDAVRKGMGNIL